MREERGTCNTFKIKIFFFLRRRRLIVLAGTRGRCEGGDLQSAEVGRSVWDSRSNKGVSIGMGGLSCDSVFNGAPSPCH